MNTTQVALTYFLALLFRMLVYSSFFSWQGRDYVLYFFLYLHKAWYNVWCKIKIMLKLFFLLVDIKVNWFLLVATLANF